MRRLAASLYGLAGLAVLGWLLSGQDWREFAPLLLASGSGLAWLCAYHFVPLLFDTLAWRVLLLEARPRLPSLLAMRWHGESVNSLLPAAQIGGDLLRARLANLAGVPGPVAAASVIVDLTLSVLTLLVFVAGGVVLVMLRIGPAGSGAAFGSLLIALMAVAGFRAAQRSALPTRLLNALGARQRGAFWAELARDAGAFTAAIERLYRDQRALWSSSALQFAAWCAGAGEIWLGLMFLGHPVGLLEALLLESLVQAVRNAAFMVPAAIGVQDGGLMLLGPLLGVPAETALALSLLKRGRELVLGAPGLAHWYWRSVRSGRL